MNQQTIVAELRVRDVVDVSEWDTAVWNQPRGNIFTSWMWGDYKTRLGWKVRRIAIADAAGSALAFIQCQERVKNFARYIYIQGGPLLTNAGEKHAEAVLTLLLQHLALRRFDLLALNFEHFQSAANVLAVLAHGFAPIVSARDHTLELDLTSGSEAMLQTTEPRWRKALRRAERSETLTARFLTDPAERLACFEAFGAMYQELKKRKKFETSFHAEAYGDLAAGDPHHLFLEIRDGGELVLVRIAHLSSTRCTDFFTASTERARASGAATLAVWRMVERSTAEGCKTFDLGGIDPAGNPGVYDFKRSLSKKVVQSGPLWLYGRTPRLRDAAGAYLAFR